MGSTRVVTQNTSAVPTRSSRRDFPIGSPIPSRSGLQATPGPTKKPRSKKDGCDNDDARTTTPKTASVPASETVGTNRRRTTRTASVPASETVRTNRRRTTSTESAPAQSDDDGDNNDDDYTHTTTDGDETDHND